jgi:hypothetical protein
LASWASIRFKSSAAASARALSSVDCAARLDALSVQEQHICTAGTLGGGAIREDGKAGAATAGPSEYTGSKHSKIPLASRDARRLVPCISSQATNESEKEFMISSAEARRALCAANPC